MARCPECNKFVSYDEPQVEAENTDTSGESLSADVRVSLNCGECSTELKEATVSVEVDLSEYHKCPALGREDSPDPDYEVLGEDVEPDMRYEGTGRYRKTFYGARVMFKVVCNLCETMFEVEGGEYEQASNFDDLT